MILRERIRCGLLGGKPDRVPLHCRLRMAPLIAQGQWIRDLGWGVVSGHPAFRLHLEGCREQLIDCRHDGCDCKRRIIETPAGQLTSLYVPYFHGGLFTIEHPFKGPEDYAPLMAMVEAMCYESAYEAFNAEAKRLGEGGYCYSWVGYDPMHEIMVRIMGVETFCYEWVDHRNQILALYEALVNKHREMYRIVADGPAEFITYGGNIQPNIVGRERFEKYYLPCYQELGNLLHTKGKRLGAHMDDKTKHLADLIARCPWDVMEAFAVPPDGDVSVAEAHRLWPNRVISLNFPSALHHASPSEIQQATRLFIEEAVSTQGILISLTEDFPRECEEKLFTNVAKVVNEMA